ncbi:hypothetical protein [Ligilactobacillus aviarius]|uniref:Uncharacterized protein n=1 Tax=Ligilactobacillus aviarius TaxID=1606 RepID=A0A179C6R9_9LACO|nr:hypothetical protein [Ligilactobacillus aviarius]OAP97429.1 hypothetical protein A3O07_01040 [Ligilactobacillus aviarius]OAQ00900.1 hypothetical protein A3O09_03790 [Ligilactobacillus aviarius]OAQ01165.1 hypothetical protein A3O08_02675 [Ligilactobacillus aviarius]OAQ06081.1 hypothetical protein A3O13_02130 [Ligilactobacillus aviarius]OAQ08700.1 hypothetical protein A3O14_03190 [Ligilactobacillus aviarius]
MKKDTFIAEESSIKWFFFMCYICLFSCLPILLIIKFFLHFTLINVIRLALLGLLVCVFVSFRAAISSPLKIDFDYRIISFRKTFNYELNGMAGNVKAGDAKKISFDDIADVDIKGLSTHLISLKFAVLLVKTKTTCEGLPYDLTKGNNIISISLNLMTCRSSKELKSVINRLKSELNVN